MAKLKISDYSSTSAGANLNTDINSIDIDEGCAPSGINNAIRTLMAQLKDFQTGVTGDSLTLGGALSGTSATFSGNVTASAISGASMTLSGDLTVDTNTLYVDSTNNNVGIGVSSPATKLSLPNDASLSFQNASGSMTGGSAGAWIVKGSDNNLYVDNFEGVTAFRGSGYAERMRIDSSGNVGIGTSSPSYKLDVRGGSIGNFNSSGNATYFVGEGTGANEYAIWRWDATNNLPIFGTQTGTVPLTFITNSQERMRIDSSGNVGIGTSSPSQKLDVVGNMLLSGQSTADQYIRIGSGRTGNGYSFIDIQGDTTYSNGIRIIRTNAGANSDSNIEHRGTGALQLVTQEAGPIIFKTSATERMRINSSGTVLMGCTSVPNVGVSGQYGTSSSSTEVVISKNTSGTTPALYIRTSGGASKTPITFYNNTSQVGSITTTTSSTAYNTSSDYRLKENITPMSGSIDRLKQLKPSTWSWVQDGSYGEGFIAHEAQTVVPEAVSGVKDAMRTEEYEVTPAVLDDDDNVVTEAVMGTKEVPDYQGIDQSKLVPLLTAALQEAITKIEALEARIAALENK